MIREGTKLLQLWRMPLLKPEAVERYQEANLKRLVRHAYHHVPFYRHRFKEARVTPADIKHLSDLSLLPICEKEDIQKAGVSELLADGVPPGSCRQVWTSGSTGKPLQIFLTPSESRQRRALEIRGLLRIGVRPWDRVVFFGPEGPFTKRFYNRLGLFRFEVVPAFLPFEEQLQLVERLRPDVFWVYPAILRSILHALDDRLSRIARPRILITSAEVLPAGVKERVLDDLLSVELFNFYGSMELGRIACECPSHSGLHVNADHLILECLTGDDPDQKGEAGSAVITCLNADAMPLIRYRLGDSTAYRVEQCDCGSGFPLIEAPKGRSDPLILLSNGQRLSTWPISFILRRKPWIRQFHLIQERPGRCLLDIKPHRGISSGRIETIHREILETLGTPFDLRIRIVEFEKPTPKFSRFSSKLDSPCDPSKPLRDI